jgi:hypothetical protein
MWMSAPTPVISRTKQIDSASTWILGRQAQQMREKGCPAEEGTDDRGTAQQVSPGVGGPAAQQQDQ